MKKINLYVAFLLIFFFVVNSNAQVGIKTTEPKTTLDINGALSLREGNALNLSDGNNNNVDLGTETYSLYRITGPTADYSISGIIPETDTDGQIVTFENTVNSSLTLKHNATSTVSNRIYCPGEKDFTLVGRYATLTLQYNKTQSRWIIVNYANNHYGNNIQSVVLPTGTQTITASGGSHTNITGASITFTPRHPIVYLSFAISGYNPLTGPDGTEQKSWFAVRVLRGATNAANFVSISAANDDVSGAVGAATVSAASFPLTVTPNVPVTIRLQGTNGGITFDSGFTIDRNNYTSYMTILD